MEKGGVQAQNGMPCFFLCLQQPEGRQPRCSASRAATCACPPRSLPATAHTRALMPAHAHARMSAHAHAGGHARITAHAHAEAHARTHTHRVRRTKCWCHPASATTRPLVALRCGWRLRTACTGLPSSRSLPTMCASTSRPTSPLTPRSL